jgi:hypothetical protein
VKGCYNDPRTELTEADKETVAKFKLWLKRKEDMKTRPEGPLLMCAICGYECFWADQFECHEVSPDVWKWICWADIDGAGLYEGK